MKELLNKGLSRQRRTQGILVLVALVAVLLLSKYFNLLPEFLDELPLHTEKSSIDVGYLEEASYDELVPVGTILDSAFYFLRDDLGVGIVTRFLSYDILKKLIKSSTISCWAAAKVLVSALHPGQRYSSSY